MTTPQHDDLLYGLPLEVLPDPTASPEGDWALCGRGSLLCGCGTVVELGRGCVLLTGPDVRQALKERQEEEDA